MAKVTFNLVWDHSDHIVTSFNTLKDCVNYIRLHVNDARKYIVEELVDGEEVDCCNAYYLLEKYKNLDTLPLTLTDC